MQHAVEVVELERRALVLATAPPQLVDDLAGAPQLHLVGNVDTLAVHLAVVAALGLAAQRVALVVARACADLAFALALAGREHLHELIRSEEHTSELQSLMRISYAVFCLKKKKQQNNTTRQKHHT